MAWYHYLLIVLAIYFTMGFGFAIASWLQACEIKVKEGKAPDSFFGTTLLWFIFAWLIVAIYCYRTEVSRTVAPVDFSKFKEGEGEK